MYVSKNYDSQSCGLVFHFINFGEKRMRETKNFPQCIHNDTLFNPNYIFWTNNYLIIFQNRFDSTKWFRKGLIFLNIHILSVIVIFWIKIFMRDESSSSRVYYPLQYTYKCNNKGISFVMSGHFMKEMCQKYLAILKTKCTLAMKNITRRRQSLVLSCDVTVSDFNMIIQLMMTVVGN